MRKALIISLVVSVITNIILVIFLLYNFKPNQHEIFRNEFPFLSPRLTIEVPNDVIINFVPLREKLNKYQNGTKNSFGIYFEYLPSGVSIGINEKDTFVLASLLKVPLVMAVYKQIEKGALKPDDILTIQEKNLDTKFGDLWKRGIGAKVTVQEAIRLALIDSDNTAKSLLFTTLPQGRLEDVFDYLDIPKEFGEIPVVTPKNYSSILRSLYLSSYLPKKDSNEILELLTQTKFDDKIVAGIPEYIKVAHKIGVAYDIADFGKSTYTDCGIVYLPKRPYILCVMTRSSEEDARKHMSEVSKIVYGYVSTANNPK